MVARPRCRLRSHKEKVGPGALREKAPEWRRPVGKLAGGSGRGLNGSDCRIPGPVGTRWRFKFSDQDQQWTLSKDTRPRA